MAFDPGAIEATLAAAVGDDPVLIAELRIAFVGSAEEAVSALARAEDAESWREAAWRLKGLAASFGAVRLMALAAAALDRGMPDGKVLARVQRLVARL